MVATSVIAANGSYTDTIGGALFQQKTVNADGSYDIRHYTAGSFFGVAFASYDQAYTAANVIYAETFYDANGNVVATSIIAAKWQLHRHHRRGAVPAENGQCRRQLRRSALHGRLVLRRRLCVV